MLRLKKLQDAGVALDARIPEVQPVFRANTRSPADRTPKFSTARFPANSSASFSGQTVAFRRQPPPPQGRSRRPLHRSVSRLSNPSLFDRFPFVFLSPTRYPANFTMDAVFSFDFGHHDPRLCFLTAALRPSSAPRRRPLVRHASPGPRRRRSLVRCTSWARSSASRPAAADPAWACALGAGQLTPAECPTAGWPFPAFPSLHGSNSQPNPHRGCYCVRTPGADRQEEEEEGRRCSNYNLAILLLISAV